MFREMRRKRQLLPQEQALEILENGTSGVLALSGDGGYPYAVPLSYVYQEGTLFFHCAKAGHKLDALRRCSKASFCVIDQDQVVPPEYTTYFRSGPVFWRTRRRNKLPFGSWRRNTAPATARSIARRPFAGRPADCALCRSPSST